MISTQNYTFTDRMKPINFHRLNRPFDQTWLFGHTIAVVKRLCEILLKKYVFFVGDREARYKNECIE